MKLHKLYFGILMESARMMVVHSLLLGVLLFVVMKWGLGQSNVVAERRSILIAAVSVIYMIVFGHGLPVKVNPI